MGFKTVTSLDADVTVALGKKNKATGKPYPKSAEGFYLGNRTVKGSRGPSTLHFLQTAEGNLGVWGTTDLNRKLSQVAAGTMVRITSTGTKPTPNGDMYTYKVEQDSDSTIEVEVAAPTAYADADETEETPAYEAEAEEVEDDSQLKAQAEAASRRDRVEAMLNKSKSK